MRVFGVLLMLASSVAGLSQITGITDLRSLQDRARPVLIFAPKPDDPRLQIQLRTLRDHAGEVHDRDIVAIALPYNNPSPSEAQLTATDAESARRKFHVSPEDFVVILIGKDGGAKLRATKPLPMSKLNDTIDAMPMRKDEIRGKLEN